MLNRLTVWGFPAFILLSVCAGVYVKAADWSVDINGDPAAEDSFLGLEEALASEKVSNGDTLNLAPGTYLHSDELQVAKSVKIQGDGTGEVILKRTGQPKKVSKTSANTIWYDPDKYGYSIRVTSSGVTFKDVTIGGWETERSSFGWVLGVGASNLKLEEVTFPGMNVRSAIVIYSEVSGLTIQGCIFSGGYYESVLRGGATNLLVENNTFEQRHWYGGSIHFDDRYPVSGKIRHNFFIFTPGSTKSTGDFNQSGLGFDAIGIFSSKLPAELLIQFNTFAWESVDAINDYDNRAQTAAIHVKEFPELNGGNLNIKDNIFYGYQTVEKDDDHKKAPLLNVPGKHGGALDFDGEDDFATFAHPDLNIGSEGTLAFWVYLYDTSKRNTLLLGPQGEGFAARNERTANDKAFEFQLNDEGKAFFYPNYSDHISGGEALVLSDTSIEVPEEWHHLAFTWDKTAVNGGEGRIYLDGFEVEYKISSTLDDEGNPRYRYDSDLSEKWLNAAITANGLFYLGRDPKDAEAGNPDKNRYLYGRVDDLAIFNDALNIGELGLIRQDTVESHLATFGDRVAAYWPLDEVSGYDLVDSTGKVTLKLGRGWQGHALIVPATTKVSNNLFFQNDVNTPHVLLEDNLLGDPLFKKSEGGALAKYALQDGSPAARSASDGNSNIGARQPDPQTVTFVVENQPFDDKLYGDTVDLISTASSGLSVQFEVVDNKSDGSGTLDGNQLTITGAGKITLKATQSGNANFLTADPVEIEFSAGKAPLTVTANDALRAKEGANPAFTLSYSGFLFNDTPSVIDTIPSATTTAGAGSASGDYPITPQGGSDDNYQFQFIDGTLTINDLLSQTVTFPEVLDIPYGEAVELTATADSGLAVSYEILVDQSTGQGNLQAENLTVTRVGEITVRATQKGNPDYNPAAPVDRTFSVIKRSLKVTALDTTRPYAEANPGFGWIVNQGDEGTAGEMDSVGVAVGRSGDLYWTGTFNGQLDLGGDTFQSIGTPDMYLTRYTSSGSLEWARHAGKGIVDGNGAVFPSTIASDVNGNVYVVGTFKGKVELGGQSFESKSTQDVFLLKYSETGSFLWASQSSGINEVDQLRAGGVAVDTVGNVYVLGEFKGSIDFGGETALASEFGTTDLFLARFNVNGTPDWVKQIGGYTEDLAGGVALDPQGQPVITGTFQGSTKLDAAVTLYSSASREMFVSKYDTTGGLIWFQQAGGGAISTLEVSDIVIGPNGSSGVTGSFTNDLIFGGQTHVSSGGADAFYAIFDATGDLVSADTFGGVGEDSGHAIVKGTGGATYVAGNFQQSLVFPGNEGADLVAQGIGDVFAVKFDATGEALWSRQIFGAGDNRIADLAIDANGHNYLAGSFQDEISVDRLASTAKGPRDAFLVQLKRDIPTLPLQYEGFLEGENVDVLDELPLATVAVSPEDGAGSEFPITIVGGNDDNYDFEFTTGVFTVVKAEQSINFYQDFSNVLYKDVINLTAVATSGLEVSYKVVTGQDIVFMPDANTLQIEGVGPVRIQADQPGNENYLPAKSVNREIKVPQAKQLITWEQDYEGRTYGDTFELTAVTDSGLPLTFTVTQGTATFEGNRITLTGAGSYSIQATQAGTFIYEPAATVEHTFEVAKAKLSVRPNDAVRRIGESDPSFALTYTGFRLADDVTVLDAEPIAYTDTNAATIPGNYDILLKNGSDDNYTYEFITGVMTVTELQTQILYFDQDFSGLTYGDSVELTAFSDSGLTVQYEVEGGEASLDSTLLYLAAAGEVTIRATQIGNEKYYPAAEVVRKIAVGKRPLKIYATSKSKREGDVNPPFTFTYSGFVRGDIEVAIDALPRATTPATESSTSGEYPIEVDGGFDDNYRLLLNNGILTVLDANKLDQSVEFTQDLTSLRYGSELTLEATASSELEVFFQVVSGKDVARVQGDKLTIVGVGEVILRATQPGNDVYNPALNVDQIFEIPAMPQTTAWIQNLPQLVYGGQVQLEGTTSSGLPIQFRVTAGEATIDNNALVPLQVGELTIEAYQSGDKIFLPSNTVIKTFVVGKATLTARAGTVVRKLFLPNPELPLYFDGFRLGDTVENLDKVPETYTTANPGTPAGIYNIFVRPGESLNYDISYEEGNLTINSGDKQPQEISFKQKLDGLQVGDIVSLTAKATSTLDVEYQIMTGRSVIDWQGVGQFKIIGPGPVIIEVTQPGNLEFEAAVPLVKGFEVPKVPQSIFWEQELQNLTYGDTATLEAGASSALPIRYAVKEGQAKVDGNQVTFTGAGKVTIQALQNGDSIHEAAEPVERSFQIRPAILLAWPMDVSREFGKDNPRFKILYDGFLFGDDESLLERIPRAETPANIDSELGIYPVNLSGGLSKNYRFKYLEGTLYVVEAGKKTQWIYFEQNLDGFDPQDFVRLQARTTSGLPVSYEILEGRHLVNLPEPNVLEFLEIGSIMIRAVQFGDEVFTPAPSVTRTFSIDGFSQEIFWDQDFSQVKYGDTIELSAIASSGNELEYSLLQGNASLAGNRITFLEASQDILLQARQTGDSQFRRALPVLQKFRVNKAPLKVYAKDVSLKATATKMPKLSFAYEGLMLGDRKGAIEVSPDIRTTAVLDSPPGQYPILLSGGSASNYEFQFYSGTLTKQAEGKRTQKISFKQDFTAVLPGDTVQLMASASSKLTVSYELLDGEKVVELTDSTLGILTAGEFTVRAFQNGNTEYNPAMETRVITIERFTQEITWRQSFTGAAYGDLITLVAEASSGLDITYQITDGSAEVSGNALTVTRPGTITVVARQLGDALFHPSLEVVQTFVASKASLLCFADGKAGIVGQAIPELTVSFEGFRLQDEQSVIDISPSAYTQATSESPADTYPIKLNKGYSELYEIKYQDGFLVLEESDNPPQVLVWTQLFDGLVYGDKVWLEGFNETVPGNIRYLVLNNGAASIDTIGFLSLEGVGEIQVAALAGPDALHNSAPPIVRTIKVGKRPLKAIAQSASRLPGAINPNFRIVYENLAEWDKLRLIEDVLDERPFTFCEAAPEAPEGTYPIYIEGGYDDQYTFQYASGILTIRDWADLWAAYEPDETGWKIIPWFGRIYDFGDKWIYHEQHGYLYGLGFDETDIWFYDYDMGWVWTGSNTYPQIYRADPGVWYYYILDTDDPRWFHDYSNGQWTVLHYEDADNDGMMDIWEIRTFGDMNRNGVRDYDRDDLNDLKEYEMGTQGNHPDTDGDGFTDGWEAESGYDPTDPQSPDDLLDFSTNPLPPQ